VKKVRMFWSSLFLGRVRIRGGEGKVVTKQSHYLAYILNRCIWQKNFLVLQELANLPTLELIQNDGSPSARKLFILWNTVACPKTVWVFATIRDLLRRSIFSRNMYFLLTLLKYSCWRKLVEWILENLQLKILISEIQGNNYLLLQKWMENLGPLLLGLHGIQKILVPFFFSFFFSSYFCSFPLSAGGHIWDAYAVKIKCLLLQWEFHMPPVRM
jgi:hypothetical protein